MIKGHKVSAKIWKRAQIFELEFARNNFYESDDWNEWWKQKFNKYKLLSGKKFANVLEVGSGPNTNIRFILPIIKYDHVYLEDPLICDYLYLNFKTPSSLKGLVKKYLLRKNENLYIVSLLKNGKADFSAHGCEDLPYKNKSMDLIVVINVFDHVQDFDLCMKEICRVLKVGGTLVLGQDLTNQEDLNNCPETKTDLGHPIKVDEDSFSNYLKKYNPELNKILPRHKGRNPKAHYGTKLFIGTKSG
jgi:SAM-dependent methyltransferase